jgi:excinuclease ABC subunit A
MAQKFIHIKGARQHNLKNINLSIPKEKLVVITGLSGSGKSSLAFDTIYAEGQRRYVESLSAYARQFLEMQEKPDVDIIEGLSPAISIEQKTTSKNPRSTVGTITEIYDYMRLLWARSGIPYSPATGLPIESQTISQMVDQIMQMQEGTKLHLLSPIARNRKGEYKKEINILQKQGYQRIKIDGKIYLIEETPKLDKNKKHNIAIVVDRIIVKSDIEKRLAQSIETALNLSDGLLITENIETGEEKTFSSKFACPVSGFTIEEIEPRLFSFNSPSGACPTCSGLGEVMHMDKDLIIPDTSKTIRRGAIAPFSKNNMITQYEGLISSVCRHYKISMDTPWHALTEKEKDILLYGSKGEVITIEWGSWSSRKEFEGIVGNLERRYKETDSDYMRHELEKYMSSSPCPSCHGKRLKPEALCVKIDNKDISQATELSITEALEWFKTLPKTFTKKQNDIAKKILKEINERLTFLINVGLNYLNLSRQAGTLSGGEAQRIRLASQIGSGLTGVLYVLDEPSIGLHQRDNNRLLNTLKKLRDQSNTVIVVEHDKDAILSADHVIDIGPGAGLHGGQIIAEGKPDDIITNKSSITGKYLKGEYFIPIPTSRRKGNDNKIKLTGAQEHNLKNIDFEINLGTLTCITGVSGSGKSTLTLDTLYLALKKEIYNSRVNPGEYKDLIGAENIDKVIDIDQSPIGRTPRSNPATYTGLFTPIREWFSKLPEAKERGYKVGRFSFNVKGGRCEACQGDGVIKIEMHFLPDVYVTCDVCKGKRYNRETLEIKYKGKSIADVLDMSVEEALAFFENIPSIRSKLELLERVGLSYIKLGQPANTLSGGEAQRIKLSKELSKRSTGKTIYILDEPTTGLHFADVHKLLEVLHELVDQGNTVIIIEHNLDVIKTADWIVDLGPEGGDGGGKIIAQGTPEQIAQSKTSHTGSFLKNMLKQ